MKKLATLILAAGMIIGSVTGANAIDFKAKGQWIMSFDYGEHGAFTGNRGRHAAYGWGRDNTNSQDDFEARQRVRLQLDAVASESLSGTVYFEIGDSFWGNYAGGGALGADGKIVKVKQAYIDWMVPETDLKVRMGIQNISLPSFTIGTNTVLDDDVAGVVASYQFNENVGVTALWARPFNDNYKGYYEYNGGKSWYHDGSYMDNLDLGALMIPFTFDGIKVTPWVAYGQAGPNTFRAGKDPIGNIVAGNKLDAANYATSGLFPVPVQKSFDKYGNKTGKFGYNGANPTSYSDIWFAGATGEFTIWDPLRIAWDFTYGSSTWDGAKELDRKGWLVTFLAEYKMDWGVPGLVFWYGSGDDSSTSNGSERMPTVSSNNTNQFSNFAFNGDPFRARDGVISNGDMGGTWGIGLRAKDMSFIEDLKHTFRVNYIGGTNSPKMAKYMSSAGLWANGAALDGTQREHEGLGFNGMYLTTQDSALEFGLTNTYKMYENFTLTLEADYMAMWLDTSKAVWGAAHRVNNNGIPGTADAWNINASFTYQF